MKSAGSGCLVRRRYSSSVNGQLQVGAARRGRRPAATVAVADEHLEAATELTGVGISQQSFAALISVGGRTWARRTGVGGDGLW